MILEKRSWRGREEGGGGGGDEGNFSQSKNVLSEKGRSKDPLIYPAICNLPLENSMLIVQEHKYIKCFYYLVKGDSS